MATTEDRRNLDGTEQWRGELYEAKPERDALFTTMSGLEVEPLATPDTVEIDYERDLGYPGVYPYTRGVYPSMHRGRLWTMRQFAGFGTAEEHSKKRPQAHACVVGWPVDASHPPYARSGALSESEV